MPSGDSKSSDTPPALLPAMSKSWKEKCLQRNLACDPYRRKAHGMHTKSQFTTKITANVARGCDLAQGLSTVYVLVFIQEIPTRHTKSTRLQMR